jgi:molybdopterin converting factor subunit 1
MLPVMRVHLRLFASLREAVGREVLELDLPEGATAEEAWQRLAQEHPKVAPWRRTLAAAVNRAYTRFDTRLADGDELVFLPPVSGG